MGVQNITFRKPKARDTWALIFIIFKTQQDKTRHKSQDARQDRRIEEKRRPKKKIKRREEKRRVNKMKITDGMSVAL